MGWVEGKKFMWAFLETFTAYSDYIQQARHSVPQLLARKLHNLRSKSYKALQQRI